MVGDAASSKPGPFAARLLAPWLAVAVLLPICVLTMMGLHTDEVNLSTHRSLELKICI
jgi:hypothetical protein